MLKDPARWDRINSFALVAYIPEPLAGFLDRLRQELVPNCFLRAHVTILPPRALKSPPTEAWNLLRHKAPDFPPFEVDLTRVEVFAGTDVIYLDVGAGSETLRAMHSAINVAALLCKEPYSYHPHVTLAQELQPDEVDELMRVARQRWAAFAFGRSFRVEKVFFVQNTRRNEWIDLGECTLGQPESKLVGELRDLLVG